MAAPLSVVTQYGVVKTHGKQKPVRIIIHTTEGDSVESALSAFRSTGYGSQYVVAPDGTIYNLAPPDQTTYGTGGNNRGSVNIEIVGHAKWSSKDWAAHAKQLQSVQRLMAYLSTRYSIPLTLSVKHGVSTHAMNSKLFKASDGHWDPGPGFPLKEVITGAGKITGTSVVFTDTPAATDSVPAAASSDYAPTGQQPASGAVGEVTPPVYAPPPTAPPQPAAGAALPGSQDYTIEPRNVQETWQMLADDPFASPETKRFAQYASGG